MRLIGHLANESRARTFADYLYVQGIENHVEFEKEHGWAVWVPDEDKIEQASGLLTAFQANPTDPKYQAQAKPAANLRAAEEKSQAAYRKRMLDRRQLFRPLQAYGFGPLTLVLILISVAVFFWSGAGHNLQAIHALFISEYTRAAGLPEIRAGQVWRLFTPIFIHYGYLHILFNMLWLWDLGSMIETRQGSLQLALLVLIIAACSNVGQYFFSGPVFGGMSGVVYGLLGYVWLRGKFDPGSGLFVHPTTVWMMIAWFFLCLGGVIPNVANMVHAIGLGMGVAWGYLSSLRYR
jgi:rhomboid protease GlpG